MEHIVQFAIGIDDEAIKRRITESAEKQIQEDLMKQIRSEIEHEIFEFYKSPWEKNEKIIGIQEWVKKLVIFLIRKRLGLTKGEHFKFANQVSRNNTYYFSDDAVMKHVPGLMYDYKSSVSLNWLLNDECEIVKVEDEVQ